MEIDMRTLMAVVVLLGSVGFLLYLALDAARRAK